MAERLLRTCKNCAAAKVKCHQATDSRVCERCSRLQKECVYAQARRRNQKTRADPRINALEAKVEQLLSALDTPSEQQPDSSISLYRASHEPGNTSSWTERTGLEDSPASNSLPYETSKSRHGEPDSNAFVRPNDGLTDSMVSIELAESLCTIYKQEMAYYFPFVVIRPDEDFNVLQHHKPFLLLAMQFAASHGNPALQIQLDTSIKSTISKRMVIFGEVSIDLLQGLLVYLAWAQYHQRPRRYAQFLQLAISQIMEMRLDQPLHYRTWKAKMKLHAPDVSDTAQPMAWDSESHRAFAGCFYLASSISTILQKLPTFPHTTYLTDVCESLSASKDCASDIYLEPIIQLQHFMEKIDRFLGQSQTSSAEALQLHFAVLRSELDTFKERLPFAMNDNALLVTQYYTTEVFLCQVSLLGAYTGSTSGANSHSWPLWRLDALRAGLIASKSVLAFYLSLPEAAPTVLNNTQLVQIGFACLVGAKLTVAAHHETVRDDTAMLLEIFDLSEVLEEMMQRLESLKTSSTHSIAKDSPVVQYQQRLASLHKWLLARLSQDRASRKRRRQQSVVVNCNEQIGQEIFSPHALDSLFFQDWNAIQDFSADPTPGGLWTSEYFDPLK